MDNQIISILQIFERKLVKIRIMIVYYYLINFERWITDSRALTVWRTEACSRENASNSWHRIFEYTQTDGIALRERRRTEAARPRTLHDGHVPRHEQTLHPHRLRTLFLRQVPRWPPRVFDRSRRGVITAEDIRDTATRLFLVNTPPQNPSMRWFAPLCLSNIPKTNRKWKSKIKSINHSNLWIFSFKILQYCWRNPCFIKIYFF